MRKWGHAAVLVSVLFALSGCGADGQDSNTAPVTLPRQGSIRVMNVMPDSGTMASFLSSAGFATSEYGDATPLIQTLVGVYVMNILLTPPSKVATTLVSNAPVNLTDQDEFSFFMIGESATAQLVRVDNIEIAFGVNLNNPAQYPLPDFQILHAATRVASADVYVTDAVADLATATPTASLNFGGLTPLAKLDPAVTYRVRVTPAGSKTVLYDSGAFGVARLQRSVYVLLDDFGVNGVSLRVANVTAAGADVFVNQTIPPSLRVANMIPDAPSIDVYLGDTTGTPLFQNVAYGVTTPYVTAVNGTQTVNITPAGNPGTVIVTGATTLAGQTRTLYASGLAADSTATFNSVLESVRSISGQAQLSFVAAAPAAEDIDVYLVVPGQPITDVAPIVVAAPLLATTSVNLSPGSYDLIITKASTTVQLLGPERISVDAGNVYTAVLLDSAGGGDPLQLQVTQEVLP